MKFRFRTNVWLATCATVVSAMTLSGCSQYNGALGFSTKRDRIRTQAAQTGSQEALRPRQTAGALPPSPQAGVNQTGVNQYGANQSGSTDAQPASSTHASMNPRMTSDRAGSGQAQVTNASAAAEGDPNRRGRAHGLSLYGRLPEGSSSNGAGKSSPMDSPDNIRRVTFATEGADFDPQIDPTGQYIVYSSTQHRKNADIYIKSVDGTAVTQLTNDPSEDMMPVFSPDGSKIAFCSNRTGNWDIYIMDLTGGQPVQITNDPADDFHPSFSPDGRRMVYCTFGNQSGQWELVVVNLDNVGPKRFIGSGLFPTWSPVAERILFQRARERGTRWFSLWTLDLVNGEGVRPTEILASSNAAAITPRWSPDGQNIVFCTVVDPDASLEKGPSQADIWVVAADGSGRTNLTKSPFANLQPVWGKDGTIYFSSNRGTGGAENIWSLRPDRALQVARDTASGRSTTTPAMATPISVPTLLKPQDRSSASVNTDQ